jgi:lipopolysaccharide export LptBFGC system permease protein LptF
MKKKLPLVFFILSISCYILFFSIGSEIDDNGYLNEPFGLLPIGALFFFLSVMIFAWNKLKS